MVESLHANTLDKSICNSSLVEAISLLSSTAEQSSSFGMVVVFTGVTLALAITRAVEVDASLL